MFFTHTYVARIWILTSRSASRRVLLGSFKKLQIDDGLMMIAMVWHDA